MDAAHKNLLYHTEVRWLSKGNVLKSILDLKEETTEFLKLQKVDALVWFIRKSRMDF